MTDNCFLQGQTGLKWTHNSICLKPLKNQCLITKMLFSSSNLLQLLTQKLQLTMNVMQHSGKHAPVMFFTC